jgi:putative resolvase
MKANEVLQLLQISRPTLHRWNQNGALKSKKLPNGHYDFDEECVYAIYNHGKPRGVYLYGRVSTSKQKDDLEHQMQMLSDFAMHNGYQIKGAYSDIASGISFKNRKEFFKLLDLVIAGKVSTVIVTYKDRLSRVGFELFEHLFKRFNTKIIVISDINNHKNDSQEIFAEMITLLHAFSMRMYPHRRKVLKRKIKNHFNE